MSIYAIGDIQGCFSELQALLVKINFDANDDILWFTGDLVNRGPASLEVLRFVKNLGDKHKVVLGNHDLHLLAVAFGCGEVHRGDTLEAILNAPDKHDLMDWLRHRPLLHHDKETAFTMVHAGIAPSWSVKQALSLANEVGAALSQPDPTLFFKQMYGNQPNRWSDDLAGMERLRCIINYLTRLRFCYADGSINLTYKGEIGGKPADLIPWFEVADRVSAGENIVFGHWAALNGKTKVAHLYALDTGCVWGNCLTAMRLEDQQRFSVKCA